MYTFELRNEKLLVLNTSNNQQPFLHLNLNIDN